MYRSEQRLQWFSLNLLVFLVLHLLGFRVHQQSEAARPLNPNMEVERKKSQSLSSSTFAASVKEQYAPNIGETSRLRGPPVLYAPPAPYFGTHEMSTGLRVHSDDQNVPIIGETSGPTGSPILYATPPYFGNHETSVGPSVLGVYVPLAKGPVSPSAPYPTTA